MLEDGIDIEMTISKAQNIFTKYYLPYENIVLECTLSFC